MLTQGLSCNVWTFTSGTRLQSGTGQLSGLVNVASFLLVDTINQEDSSSSVGMNVLPVPLRSLYKDMYKLSCGGVLVVLDSDHYNFSVTSDDASVLYLDGSKLVDNDEAHATRTVSNVKYLRRGVHTFRIDYAQNYGRQSLVIKANGELIDAKFYAH
jgi:hypothetical protein